MLEARHTSWAHVVFWLFLRLIFRCSFQAIYFLNQPPRFGDDETIIFTPNHSTWWDGFIAYLINRKVFGRRLYLMMLESQLRRFSFFTRVGVFSVNKESPKSLLKTIQYASSLLKADGSNLLVVFPQGELTPDVDVDYKVRLGLSKLKPAGATKILPLYFRIEPLVNRKPTLLIYFGEVLDFAAFQENSKSLEEAMSRTRVDAHQKLGQKELGILIAGSPVLWAE